jgi:hypothetical protein
VLVAFDHRNDLDLLGNARWSRDPNSPLPVRPTLQRLLDETRMLEARIGKPCAHR